MYEMIYVQDDLYYDLYDYVYDFIVLPCDHVTRGGSFCATLQEIRCPKVTTAVFLSLENLSGTCKCVSLIPGISPYMVGTWTRCRLRLIWAQSRWLIVGDGTSRRCRTWTTPAQLPSSATA